GCHFLSGGGGGFVRGPQDTPQDLAPLLLGGGVNPNVGAALVALVMARGGGADSRQNTETMKQKNTNEEPGSRFHGQPGDVPFGDRRESARPAGVNHARLRRLPVRYRRRQPQSPVEDDPHHPSGLGDDLASRSPPRRLHLWARPAVYELT